MSLRFVPPTLASSLSLPLPPRRLPTHPTHSLSPLCAIVPLCLSAPFCPSAPACLCAPAMPSLLLSAFVRMPLCNCPAFVRVPCLLYPCVVPMQASVCMPCPSWPLCLCANAALCACASVGLMASVPMQPLCVCQCKPLCLCKLVCVPLLAWSAILGTKVFSQKEVTCGSFPAHHAAMSWPGILPTHPLCCLLLAAMHAVHAATLPPLCLVLTPKEFG